VRSRQDRRAVSPQNSCRLSVRDTIASRPAPAGPRPRAEPTRPLSEMRRVGSRCPGGIGQAHQSVGEGELRNEASRRRLEHIARHDEVGLTGEATNPTVVAAPAMTKRRRRRAQVVARSTAPARTPATIPNTTTSGIEVARRAGPAPVPSSPLLLARWTR
jgi:hypothetical protein